MITEVGKNITGDDERSFLVHGHCLQGLRGELKIFHTKFRASLKKIIVAKMRKLVANRRNWEIRQIICGISQMLHIIGFKFYSRNKQ